MNKPQVLMVSEKASMKSRIGRKPISEGLGGWRLRRGSKGASILSILFCFFKSDLQLTVLLHTPEKREGSEKVGSSILSGGELQGMFSGSIPLHTAKQCRNKNDLFHNVLFLFYPGLPNKTSVSAHM